MSHEEKDYIQILRSQGYRVTPQRLIVLDAVCDIGGHAAIATVVARVKKLDPTIDLSTIYRALDVLGEVGLVVATEIGDEGKVYKIAGEATHHHLICQNCGTVLSISHDEVNPLFAHLQEKYGSFFLTSRSQSLRL
ncbi:MAG: Fur family transcriptional regulator [Anaerolineae bacterium]|nr:Fur family transcriptional regulator [Anaerolineae bacterium]